MPSTMAPIIRSLPSPEGAVLPPYPSARRVNQRVLTKLVEHALDALHHRNAREPVLGDLLDEDAEVILDLVAVEHRLDVLHLRGARILVLRHVAHHDAQVAVADG